jgi:hypothetical protein
MAYFEALGSLQRCGCWDEKKVANPVAGRDSSKQGKTNTWNLGILQYI